MLRQSFFTACTLAVLASARGDEANSNNATGLDISVNDKGNGKNNGKGNGNGNGNSKGRGKSNKADNSDSGSGSDSDNDSDNGKGNGGSYAKLYNLIEVLGGNIDHLNDQLTDLRDDID